MEVQQHAGSLLRILGPGGPRREGAGVECAREGRGRDPRAVLSGLAQASYAVACEQSGVAAIVDPRRDVEDYVEWAAARGLTIRHVVLTHLHADFLAGHIELRERVGATIHVGARAEVDYPAARLADGDVLELGPSASLRALEKPGHTPESICLVAEEPARGAPRAVLTGDTLFVGDVGRPDLMASVGVTAHELATQLYDSTRRLLELPDETVVYPGHGAGSMCGKNLGSET
ncbi:MAG: MBL fold metallo-hydrolase [Planctomycetota bacterium]